MGECGKGGKEWARVDKSGIFFKCGKGGKEWVRVGKSGIFFKCGKGGKGVGESW